MARETYLEAPVTLPAVVKVAHRRWITLAGVWATNRRSTVKRLVRLRNVVLWGAGAFAVGTLYALLYNLAQTEWGPATSLLIWLMLALGVLLAAWAHVRRHWRFRGWYRADRVVPGAVIRLVPSGNPVVADQEVQRVLNPDELVEVISWPKAGAR